MGYKIYELVKPEILKNTEPDGYHIITTELITLKETECPRLDYNYNSEIEARVAIEQNKTDLKSKDLVILDVVSVNWEGETS